MSKITGSIKNNCKDHVMLLIAAGNYIGGMDSVKFMQLMRMTGETFYKPLEPGEIYPIELSPYESTPFFCASVYREGHWPKYVTFKYKLKGEGITWEVQENGDDAILKKVGGEKSWLKRIFGNRDSGPGG
ncbi:MAG TPA: hypothetical protein PLY85_11395 [Anaerolineaceae bacterium]|nr:hypothetical protein [Anaerolineaceae bacterium]HQP09611.1 hypothetical protein [Anaerolineaceae bacterium]